MGRCASNATDFFIEHVRETLPGTAAICFHTVVAAVSREMSMITRDFARENGLIILMQCCVSVSRLLNERVYVCTTTSATIQCQ
jgi:hypothetical protein